MDAELTFQPQSEGQTSVECVNIPITNDGILEADETFTAELRSDNPDISANTSANRATIEIVNDDSKIVISQKIFEIT